MAANRGYPVTYDLTSFGWHLNALSGFNPMRLHQKLMEHPDYKMRWVDTVQKEMVNPDGALSLSNSLARWNAREDELRQVMYAEAARWGHSHNYNTWVDECDYVKNTFIAQSAKILLPQLVNRGWFPKITTPTITKKGVEFLERAVRENQSESGAEVEQRRVEFFYRRKLSGTQSLRNL